MKFNPDERDLRPYYSRLYRMGKPRAIADVNFIDSSPATIVQFRPSRKNQAEISLVSSFMMGNRWPFYKMALKRFVDIVFALLGLAILSPLLLLVAILIKIKSPGPALFWQPRVGKNGQTFLICKFRTMHAASCDPSGIRHIIPDDPRVFSFGRFLRRRSIDELPQLFNVLRGEMSLVGPRAHPVGMVVNGQPYEAIVPNYPLRHCVKPGITGLAQIEGFRGQVPDNIHAIQRVQFDLKYIQTFSLRQDFSIMARTIFKELRNGSGE
jgi:lipopolysaccharide/colanic/teichoic acid biosynthesis glycosyltransferase